MRSIPFILALFLLVGITSGITLQNGVTQGTTSTVNLTSGTETYTQSNTGFWGSTMMMVDDTYITPSGIMSNNKLQWMNANANTLFTYDGNTLKSNITLPSYHKISWTITNSPNSQLIPWDNGNYKIVSLTSGDTMDGIVIEKPSIIDANGRSVPASYSLSGNTLSLNYNGSAFTYPYYVDPTWTSANGCWTASYVNITGYNTNVVMWNQTGNNSWTVPAGVTSISYLIVAGGGGGGVDSYAAGGGAGGVLLANMSYATTPGDVLQLYVGPGGAGGTVTSPIHAQNGNDSIFNINALHGLTAVAKGGGGAGGALAGYDLPYNGGSGGGASYYSSPNSGGASTQSSNGGANNYYGTSGGASSSGQYAGGGGGAGSAGSTGNGGNGGTCIYVNITGNNSAYAGGGGAGVYGANAGAGGCGIGGTGVTTSSNGNQGVDGTGSGGGGSGGYTGWLSGGRGASGTIIISYQILSLAPTASFTINQTSGLWYLPIMANDTSTGSPTAWQWSVNQTGTIAPFETYNTHNVSFSLSTGGNYTLTLNASNANGFSYAQKFIQVYSPTSAGFTASPTSGYSPLTVSFTDQSTNATSWYWIFGDGNTSTSQSPVFIYRPIGTFSVDEEAINPYSIRWSNQTNYITTSAFSAGGWCGAQTLFFSDNRSDIGNGLYGQLINSVSNQPQIDENITITSAQGIVPIDNYTSNSGYPGAVTLLNGVRTYYMWSYVSNVSQPSYLWMNVSVLNQSGSETPYYNISTAALPISLTQNIIPYTSISNLTFLATDRLVIRVGAQTKISSGTTIHFVNGDSSHASYVESGYFNCPSTSNVPVALISQNMTSGRLPLTVQFYDTSLNGNTSVWEFGDGNSSTMKNPIYTYTAPGIYTVNLTSDNSQGSSILSESGLITVLSPHLWTWERTS